MTSVPLLGSVSDTETGHLRQASLPGALATLLRARGVRVAVVDTSDWPKVHTAAFLLASSPGEVDDRTGDALWRMVPITRDEEENWRSDGADTETQRSLVEDLLMFLDDTVANPSTLADYLSGAAWASRTVMGFSPPSLDAVQVAATRAAALDVWWSDRMSEGHTPGPEGSAHLLLALTLPAALMGALAYTTDGTPTLDTLPAPAA